MYKIYSLYISTLLLVQCSIKQQEVYPVTYSKPKLDYRFDTIFRTYKGDFTKQYVGGIDLIFKDSTTFVVYTFCGSNELKIVDFASDSLLELQMYNPDFKELHTTIKKKDIFVLTPDGKIWQYCDGTPNKEPFFDLMADSIFKHSGLVPSEFKPGGDQYVRIPEDVMYFEVALGDSNGKYSKMDYDYPLVAKYNFSTNKVSFFGKTPRFMIEQDYGLVSLRYDLFMGDSIITSDSYNGRIAIINTLDNTEKVIEAKSKYDIYPIKKWKYTPRMKDAKNNKMQHALESSNYEALFYNPFTKKYYRVFHPRMEKMNKEGLLNTEEDKQSILMVFDKNFNIVDEVLLPINRRRTLKLFPIKDGVAFYLPELFKTDSKKMTYSYFNIHHN